VALVGCRHERPPVADPLPAPRRIVEPTFGPALAETKRLVDLLLTTPREPMPAVSGNDVRAWALEGWMPAQAKRRELFAQIEASLPKQSDFGPSALLEGRAMESLADDWRNLNVVECSSDPTVCAMAARVANNARQVWIERARERYESCSAFLHDGSDTDELCETRADGLRKPQR
jgi:hypothetical protein